jgi:hypothetical protein
MNGQFRIGGLHRKLNIEALKQVREKYKNRRRTATSKKEKKIMLKTAKIIFAVMTLICLFAINGFVSNVFAQKKGVRIPCPKPSAAQIYFVDSGQSVTYVRPGSNGGNGYQLNILGTGVDKFQLVKEPYMTSVSLVYANHTQAKWQIFFAPNMGREISKVRLWYECAPRGGGEFQLTENVKLLDQ